MESGPTKKLTFLRNYLHSCWIIMIESAQMQTIFSPYTHYSIYSLSFHSNGVLQDPLMLTLMP